MFCIKIIFIANPTISKIKKAERHNFIEFSHGVISGFQSFHQSLMQTKYGNFWLQENLTLCQKINY